MTKLSENLKLLRENKNLTQGDVAGYLEITTAGYNKYEKATAEPSIKNLIKLADFFSVSLDDLIGREFNKESEPIKQILLKKQIDNELKGVVKEVVKEIIDHHESTIKTEVYKRLGVE